MATSCAPSANYSGVAKFSVASTSSFHPEATAILSVDNALGGGNGSAPVPIDVPSSQNLVVASPAAINAPASFHLASTLTIQSAGLTGTGTLTRENQPMNIVLANAQALSGSQLTGFIQATDNIILAADNIQHLDTLAPKSHYTIPQGTFTETGSISLNGATIRGLGNPSVLQGDLVMNVGASGLSFTTTNPLIISTRIQATGPVSVSYDVPPVNGGNPVIIFNNSNNNFQGGLSLNTAAFGRNARR